MSMLSSQGGVEVPVRTARRNGLEPFMVATAKTARDLDRRIVLNLIRKHQPISRADLARHSRLRRRTVSAITEQLIAERWVTMGAQESVRRRRRPRPLHLNGNRAGILGVDVQPAETSIAVADLNLRFLAEEKMPTSDNAGRFVHDLCKRLVRLAETHSQLALEGIGVVLPGRIDLATGRLAFAPNLPWKSVELKKPIERATGLSVELENAANACALAEMWSGRYSERVRNLVAVSIAEGIGVGMILNGQMVRGSTGFAGEFGHVTIEEDGLLCHCGKRGCLEACASNTAVVRYFSELVADEDSGRRKIVDFDAVLRLVKKGDACACAALHRMAKCLGTGMAMLAAGLSPDVIVLAGEVTGVWKRLGPIIKETVEQRLVTRCHTRILPAHPRTHPRLHAAMALVLQKQFGALQIA